jgi:hypothetical protein
MKNKGILSILLVAFGGLFLMAGCAKDDCKTSYTYTMYTPVYMSYHELRNSVASTSPRDLENPGKIYVFGSYLFINEVNEGIHVIDNSDPHNPTFVSFIEIPGNIDMAVNGNYLYADSYVDLVVLDISNPSSAQEVGRELNMFPNYTINSYQTHPDSGVIVDYDEELVTEVYDGPCDGSGPIFYPVIDVGGGIFVDFDVVSGGRPMTTNGLTSGNEGVRNVGPSGQGGSMARFTLSQGRLYTVNETSLNVVSISSPTDPVPGQTVNLGWGIETIFPYSDKLFVGAMDGMHILDVSSPDNPVHISSYNHITSCDPVVVDGNYAYVTLRSGTQCQGFTNQLDLVDISDIYNPSLVKSWNMNNPHGLGLDTDLLFLCDGDDGLKIFNNQNPLQVGDNQVFHYTNIQSYDVIPFNNVLMMIGEDGLFQYDYSDPSNIYKISEIRVN